MGNPVIDYYTTDYNEDNRHKADAFGIIQEYRTKELISRYLHLSKMTVLDVGGANGVYSFYLADQGHTVSLLDIVPSHIEKVKFLNEKRASQLKQIYLGDARDFSVSEKFDMIILHGPLYHIVDLKERIDLLRNMKARLNPDGVILGFGINRYAGYFYGVRSGNILDKSYRETVLKEVKSGYRNKEPGWYFHKDEELIKEFKEAGLSVRDIKSVTTQLWMIPGIEDRINDPHFLEEIMEIAMLTEDETAIGQDLLCVGGL